MNPINFKESNTILKRPADMTENECGPLVVYSDGKICLSCWRLNFLERLKVLIFGKIWLFVHSGKTQPPVSLGCWRSAFREK